MTALLLRLINMSITAGWLILAVVLLRLVFKRTPKRIVCGLWGLAAIRLICPLSIKSVLSLIPSSRALPDSVLTGNSFEINSGIDFIDSRVNGYLGDRYFEGVTVPAHNGSNVMEILSVIWLVGMAVLILYAVISCLRIRSKVRESIVVEKDVRQCDRISTPFIFGIFRPRIYLPSLLSEYDKEYVLAHERAHLKRRDHYWKPIGFALLTVYWFDPLIWLAYILLCRDIELACDERVIANTGESYKKSYSNALINCSQPVRMTAACPLAFGETDVKGRVKNVLNFKKPTFWVIIISVVLCAVVAVCFLTDPKTDKTQIQNSTEPASYENAEIPSEATVKLKESEVFKSFCDRIGKKEVVEDGVRYIYSTSYSEEDNIYTFTKENADLGKVVGKITVNADTGDIVSMSSEPELIERDSEADEEKSSPLEYQFMDSVDSLPPRLTLYPETQEFQFTYSVLSSYLAVGKYTLDGDMLILDTDDGLNHYEFAAENGSYIFNEKKSSPIPVYRYAANAEPQCPVPDGAVFEYIGKEMRQ